jgi:nucleoside-diphosphate kinase
MVKPDGVQRGLVGHVILRLESKGLKLVAAKLLIIDDALAARHYEEHKGKPFYEPLIKYITSGPVLATVWEGKGAVSTVRTLVGKTNPLEAAPGTIRGDFGMETGRNIIHASDSKASAERETSLFFTDDELLSYVRIDEEWVYE